MDGGDALVRRALVGAGVRHGERALLLDPRRAFADAKQAITPRRGFLPYVGCYVAGWALRDVVIGRRLATVLSVGSVVLTTVGTRCSRPGW